jgi:hypothetical protein
MTTDTIDRDEAIRRIKAALKRRSGKSWSVTGGRGTAWGWITITSPPARRVEFDAMTAADKDELGRLLGLDGVAHCDGVQVPAGHDYRLEFVDRAEGRAPAVRGRQYWD